MEIKKYITKGNVKQRLLMVNLSSYIYLKNESTSKFQVFWIFFMEKIKASQNFCIIQIFTFTEK